MRDWNLSVSPEIVLIAVLAVTALAATGFVIYRKLSKPKDPEQARRLLIEANGRIIEGMVVDYQDGAVFYEWNWRGVEYHPKNGS